MTKRQKQLAQKHGTPEQFEAAVLAACDTLMVTTAEAEAAIRGFSREWANAATTAPADGALVGVKK